MLRCISTCPTNWLTQPPSCSFTPLSSSPLHLDAALRSAAPVPAVRAVRHSRRRRRRARVRRLRVRALLPSRRVLRVLRTRARWTALPRICWPRNWRRLHRAAVDVCMLRCASATCIVARRMARVRRWVSVRLLLCAVQIVAGDAALVRGVVESWIGWLTHVWWWVAVARIGCGRLQRAATCGVHRVALFTASAAADACACDDPDYEHEDQKEVKSVELADAG